MSKKTGALNGPAKAFSVKMPLVAQSVGYVSRYGPVRMERSTRDIVARTSYLEITEGRGTPARGVWINVSHIGQAEVKRLFPGMVARTRLIGRDLACEPGKV